MKTAYLASPLGFAASTQAFMRELEAALSAIVRVDNPWNNIAAAVNLAAAEALTDRQAYQERLHAIDLTIARANEAAIRACDLVVAVLDGVDVDSGTASEIGFAYALGKPVAGLRSDFRLAGDNAGTVVNLQVQYWIEASGSQVVTTTDDLLAAVRALAEIR